MLLAGFPVLLIGMVYAVQLGMIGAGLLPSTGSVSGDLAYSAQMLWASAPMAAAAALAWFAIAYIANQGIIDVLTGAKKVTRESEPELYNLLENLAISRGMKTPALRIIETEGLNAFATGLHEGRYSVTVTRGLMNALDRGELEAVLAHELTHVINKDVRTMVIASVFAGIISLLAQAVYRAIMWGGAGRRAGRGNNKGAGLFILVAIAAVAIGYVLAIVIRMTLSRSREYVADAGAVELTKNPDAMISALRKIEGRSTIQAPQEVQGMFIENKQVGIGGLFATHPPIAKRIAALEQYAGGRAAPIVEPAAAGPWN